MLQEVSYWSYIDAGGVFLELINRISYASCACVLADERCLLCYLECCQAVLGGRIRVGQEAWQDLALEDRP
ncbi:hypothetical protein D3C84_1114920 [compost metagenome]